MASPIPLNKLEKDSMVPAPDLHHLLATGTNHYNDVALERLIRLNSLYGKDAPRDLFTATSAFLENSRETDAHSDERKTYPTNTSSIESTDSEKAVKGSDDESPTDVQINSQEVTVKELAGHIPNDSSDELYRRGKEVGAIMNGADRAFNVYFGSHFDQETSSDTGFWPLAASNREEAEAMVEGLERAHEAIQITFE